MISHYEELQFIVINEILLVGTKMLKFVDCKLRDVKHVQNRCLGIVDDIFYGIFFQDLSIQDVWIFNKRLLEGFDGNAPDF